MSTLTDNQLKVIKLMQDGWVMTVMAGRCRKVFIQKDNQTFKVYIDTFRKLIKQELIQKDNENFLFSFYVLTEVGKQIPQTSNTTNEPDSSNGY